MQTLRHYLLAVQFFTRIPITGRLADWVGFSPALLRASSAHFPGVGLLVALVAMGIYGALHWALGGGLPIAAAGSLVGAIGVSGAPGGDADKACAQAGIRSIEVDLEF